MTRPTLVLRDVEFTVPDAPRPLLTGLDWMVRPGEHWAVVGSNGAGKSTLLRIAAGALAPTRGTVQVREVPHGAPGLSDPRLRVSTLEGAPRTFAAQLSGLEIVVLKQSGPVAIRGMAADPADASRARELLELLGAGHLVDRRYASCSEGERQRILLARALLRDPDLLLLDEPVAALDLVSREALLQAMVRLATERPELATVTVTHHLEELAPSTTHALLLREGKVVVGGPIESTLDATALQATFGVPVAVNRLADRWAAHVLQPDQLG